MSARGKSWCIALSVVTCLALLAAPAVAGDRALLIGVGSYPNLPPKFALQGPKNDLLEMQGLLTGKLGFDPSSIRILKDEEATRAEVLSSMNTWLVEATAPGDRVYIYFSGHGLQVKDVDGDEQDGLDEALAPVDIVSGETDWQGAILDDEIDRILERLQGRAVTMVIDACHSGTISRSLSDDVSSGIEGARFLPRPHAKPVEQALTRGLRIDLAVVDKPKLVEAGVTAWSAAAPYQVAWDDVRLPVDERHGVFTAAFVAGQTGNAADANGNGLTSNAELLEFLKSQSTAYCSTQDKCSNLDPQLESKAQALGESAVVPEKLDAGGSGQGKYHQSNDPSATPTTYQDTDAVDAVGDIIGKTEIGDVELAFDRPTTMKTGDVFKLTVTSRTSGDLLLFDVNSQGKATQIFPNEFAQKITPLAPNVPLTLPDDYYGFDFEASGEGDSVFVALVVSDTVDLSDVAPKSRGLKVELNARETLSDIVARLQKTWAEDLDRRGIRWSVGTLRYRVE
ncbi:caspase family protein [Ensifer adhaerens]|uniref:caspase family protein n=1 Tax=Ensifer adhaerens TaxID=106592 RepID=UPI0023A9E5EB|nr:caspase family protein [Ensifer adhaerens]WDZ78119.1 caspase family protein [Ensifer adhaerens]